MAGKRRYSGPLMRGQKSVRQRMAKKPRKKGLNAIEKKQVNAIVRSNMESKYFDAEQTLDGQQLKQQQNTSDALVWVRAFAVGNGQVAGVNANYGWQSNTTERAITAQHMVRTFSATLSGSPADTYLPNLPDGKEVMPSMCRTQYRIYRNKVNIASDDIAKAAPYRVRMIRVLPKRTKFSNTTYTPKDDLFLNTFGVAYGVNSGNNGFQEKFGQMAMMTAKVNTRKYRLLQDTQFTLKCPLVDNAEDLRCFETNAGTEKIITVNHKQPKKLTYTGLYDSEANREPITGQSGELIFFHVCILGYDGSAGQDIQPSLLIDVKSVSTFKDA